MTDALDAAEPKADVFVIRYGEEPFALIDIGHEQLNAVLTRIINEVLHLLAVVHHHAQVGSHKGGRVMDLEVGCLICHVGIRSRMRLIEAVARELFHQVEDLGRNGLLDVALRSPLDEHRTLALHLLDIFFAHGSAQQIGAAKRIAAHNLRHTHHLFLINHDAVGFLQNRLHARVQILDLFSSELTRNEGRNQVHRTRTIECVQSHQIFQAVGLSLLQ